ncbi:MAG: TlpA disulfide reductase family protein [Polyangiaceae bacterium]
MRRRRHQSLCFRVLGGLPTLTAALLLCAGLGCDDKGKDVPVATRSRSQVVTASAQSPSATPTASTSTVAAKPRRALCGGQLEPTGRALPEVELERRAAAGSTLPPAALQGPGWVWVNFWAAWCAPCKEEIPRLKGWEAKLRSGGQQFRVAFVSLDDDERQLRDMLESQPKQGVKASLWLKEGAARGEFLKGAGVGEDPELPAHLLLDASGKIRCAFSGAVEDADFPQLQRLIAGS